VGLSVHIGLAGQDEHLQLGGLGEKSQTDRKNEDYEQGSQNYKNSLVREFFVAGKFSARVAYD
tara:strand:+ start:1713 stop:1901 length:189 start_codon:yes stop_codon:yes gene_type:complete